MSFTDFDIQMMELALELSQKGLGKVNPNPLVGAVLVKNGQIIGQGYHEFYGGSHAEVGAIKQAGLDAKGADIYVTLEPCSHQGLTSPCADLLIKAGVANCFIATLDPNPLVAGNGVKKLEAAGIKVFVGLCSDKARQINAVFFKYITSGLPYIFLKYASSLDGKIAARSKAGEKITNQEVWTKVHNYRNKFSGILVGINTLINDNPKLDCRLENGRNPMRFVIDPNLKTSEEFDFIKNNADEKSVIITSEDNAGSEKFNFLKEKYNIKFILLKGKEFNLTDVFKKIGEMKIDSVFVEGGGRIISQILDEEIYDAGEVFIAPIILGDEEAVAACSGRECVSVKDAIKLPNVGLNIYKDNVGFEFYK